MSTFVCQMSCLSSALILAAILPHAAHAQGDDVIATLRSQGPFDNCTAINNIEHTGVFNPTWNYDFIVNLAGYSDCNVTNNQYVNDLIVCTLAANGSPGCSVSPPDNPCSSGDDFSQKARLRRNSKEEPFETVGFQAAPRRSFFVNDGLKISPPTRDLVLGEENDLYFTVACRDMNMLHSEQQSLIRGGTMVDSGKVEGGGKDLPILWSDDGKAKVKVVPMRLGDVKFRFMGRCADGGISFESAVLRVVPPLRSPEKVIISTTGAPRQDYSPVTLSLEGRLGTGRRGLGMFVFYPGVKEPVKIDPRYVKYTVRTRDGNALITLDPASGVIRPLALGHALVDTEYGGKKQTTCIAVVQKSFERDDGSSYPCRKLMAGPTKVVRP